MTPDALPSNPASQAGGTLSSQAKRLVRIGQSAAFWLAVALPLVYLPMIAFGLASDYPFVFVALLGANALSLGLGHPYGQS